MDLVKPASVELTYTPRGAGLRERRTALRHHEGSLAGDRLHGTLTLTDLARRRPDNVSLPIRRGLLTTDDGAVDLFECRATVS